MEAKVRAALERCCQRGRAAWPAMALDPAAVEAYVAARVPSDADAEAIDRLHAEDLVLCCAALGGDPRAVGAVTDLCAQVARRRLRGRGSPPSDQIDEVVQALLTRLFVPGADGSRPRLGDYTGRGPLVAWLGIVAARLSSNLWRAAKRSAPLDHELAERIARSADAEGKLLHNRYADAFRVAFREALAELDADARLLLKLHYVERLTMDELAAMSATSRATAHRRLAAARDAVYGRSRDLLVARLGVAPRELDEVLRLLRSQLHVSLAGLLR